MVGDSTTVPSDAERFRKLLAEAVARARSLDEIVDWLKQQPFVTSVTAGDALLKSNPPQREIVVQRKGANDATQAQVVRVFELGPDQFELSSLRER